MLLCQPRGTICSRRAVTVRPRPLFRGTSGGWFSVHSLRARSRVRPPREALPRQSQEVVDGMDRPATWDASQPLPIPGTRDAMSVPTTGCESDSSVQFVEGNLIMTITVAKKLTFSMDVKDLLALVIASYGAVLSTIVFRSQQADKKQKLRVRRKEGMFTYGATIGEVQVIVEAANIGRVVVVVDGFGICLPDGNHLVFPGLPQVTNLPVKISPRREGRLLCTEKRSVARTSGAGLSPVRSAGAASNRSAREYARRRIIFI